MWTHYKNLPSRLDIRNVKPNFRQAAITDLRMKLFFNEVLETRKIQASKTQKKTSLDQQTVQTLVESEKWVDLEDMEEDYAEFVNKFKSCIRQSANPSSSSAESDNQNRISDTTKLLLDKRRAMKRESGINNIEYDLLCHLIRFC